MKKQATNNKLVFHFIIGFIVYQIIGNILSSVVDVIFNENSTDLFLKYGEKTVYIVYFLITALIIHFIATFLSVRSLYKNFEITKDHKKGIIIPIATFFLVVALITGLLNSEKFVMVFIINIIVLLLMLGYVYLKISSVSNFDFSYKKASLPKEQPVTFNKPETIIPDTTEPNKEINTPNELKSNTRFNPLTGTVEEIPQSVIDKIPEKQPIQTNLFNKPVEQQEQSMNYMDIFTNPPKNNNEEEKK